jgi:hypothetical protein
VTLNWSAPGSTGGAPITGYRISPYIGATAQSPINTGSTATSRTITGLTNGTAYTFRVAATNSAGTSADSTASAAVTPRAATTAPGAPTGVSGSAGNASVALSWSAPADDGGAAITGYRITPYVGPTAQTPINTGSTATSANVAGLTVGTAYTFTVAATNSAGTGTASAPTIAITPTSSPYSQTIFTDGFESGGLTNWNQSIGNGAFSVSAAGARQGSYGLRLNNAAGQYAIQTKTLSSALVDSSTRFWVRIGATSGFVTVAQARDANSSGRMWELLYNASSRGFYFFPYRSAGSVEVYTGNNSTPAAGTWMEIEVRYRATNPGGAQIYINGQTQASWSATGDFTRTSNLTILQLWNDQAGTVDFDDVSVARPPTN